MSSSRRITLLEILLLVAFVLLFRVLLEGPLPLGNQLRELLRHYPMTLFMIAWDIALLALLRNFFEYGKNSLLRTLTETLGVAIVSLFCGLLLRDSGLNFRQCALTAFVFNAVLVAVVDIFLYYGSVQKKALTAEKNKKDKARYQYQQLKRQLNPHFLFNSLNSLDYLIRTNPEKASQYVHQLAALYRYMLSMENEPTVLLREEMEFVGLYANLLSQRFDSGLQITIDIPPEDLHKRIIPCGVQLLVENAHKHNVVSVNSPLQITIRTANGFLIVHNNRQPKMNQPASTGVGLNNIMGQYRSAFGKEIEIEDNEAFFEVRLPLLD